MKTPFRVVIRKNGVLPIGTFVAIVEEGVCRTCHLIKGDRPGVYKLQVSGGIDIPLSTIERFCVEYYNAQ